jgi:cell wall-associated NlpC family hydrolase
MYGICNLSIVPCRKEPSHRSEMVTQLLFGEHFTILEETEEWTRIKQEFDGYESWISSKQYLSIKQKTFSALSSSAPVLSNELIGVIDDKQNDISFPVVMGSALPYFNKGAVKMENTVYNFDGNISDPGLRKNAKDLVELACQFLNAPYLWGGRSVMGIDCSGFTQLVYKLNGYKLPRDAYQQAELGSPLSFVEEAEAGDLAFFDNEEGKITHVGIVLSEQRIIHASGKVRIDKFDHYGIFHTDRRKYSHLLRVIKRFV